MPVEIYFMQARDGDCILLRYSSGVNLLVDTGYHATYTEHLKPRLLEWARAGQGLDYCIITHVDADHIEGAVEGLFPDNQASDNPCVIYIGQVWHNSYRHLRQNYGHINPSSPADSTILKSIVGRKTTSHSDIISGLRLLNAKQGTSLSAQLVKYGYAWNTSAGEGPLVAPFRVDLAPGIICQLISPVSAGLTKLASRWETELAKRGVKGRHGYSELMEEAYEFWQQTERWLPSPVARPIVSTVATSPIAYLKTPFLEDKSPTNGSSLAFVLEEENTRLLLLGDAHPSVVLDELTRLYGVQLPQPWWFDCIKLSHHGSFANNSPALLQATDSDCYLISTNGGRHHHPDLATLAWVVTRPLSRLGQIRQLYCNYLTPTVAQFNRSDWQETYHYTIKIATPEQPLTIAN